MRMGGARPNAVELTDAYVRAFEEWRETGEDAIWDTAASLNGSAPLPTALRTVVSGATVHDLGVVGAR